MTRPAGEPYRGFVVTDEDGVQTRVDEWMVCEVCGRVLERLGGETWLHPTDMRVAGEDHKPVPVPRTEAKNITEVCDFCFAPNPQWELPTKNFPMPHGARMDVSTSGWACCNVCAKLIDKGLWSGLTKRAIASFAERHGGEEMNEQQEAYLRRLYRLVRKNAVGPVQPNNPRVDKEYGEGTGETATVLISAPTRWSGEGSSRAGR